MPFKGGKGLLEIKTELSAVFLGLWALASKCGADAPLGIKI